MTTNDRPDPGRHFHPRATFTVPPNDWAYEMRPQTQWAEDACALFQEGTELGRALDAYGEHPTTDQGPAIQRRALRLVEAAVHVAATTPPDLNPNDESLHEGAQQLIDRILDASWVAIRETTGQTQHNVEQYTRKLQAAETGPEADTARERLTEHCDTLRALIAGWPNDPEQAQILQSLTGSLANAEAELDQ